MPITNELKKLIQDAMKEGIRQISHEFDPTGTTGLQCARQSDGDGETVCIILFAWGEVAEYVHQFIEDKGMGSDAEGTTRLGLAPKIQ